MGYQRFVINVKKLGNVKEAEDFFEILKDYVNSIRDFRWGYFPVIKIKRKNGYEIEVAHLGCYSKRPRKKLTVLKAKLKKRFKNVSIRYLDIKRLREI
jgi:hypothetical protein